MIYAMGERERRKICSEMVVDISKREKMLFLKDGTLFIGGGERAEQQTSGL